MGIMPRRSRHIKTQILLVTLLPAAILIVGLSSYLLSQRFRDLDQAFQRRGEVLSEQLASASLYDLLSHNYPALKLLVEEAATRNTDLARVEIRGKDDQVLLSKEMPGFRPEALREFQGDVSTERGIDIYDYFLDHPFAVAADGDFRLGHVHLWIDSGQISRQKADILSGTILFSLLAFSLTALLGYALSRRIAGPVEQLTDAVIRMRDGDLKVRVNPRGDGEIAALEQGFNAMAEEIDTAAERMHQQVAQATKELNQSMEELEVKNIQLDLARRQEREVARMKQEFLANMSHEIRTPMNGILGFTKLLRGTPMNAKQSEYLNTIEDSAANLLTIINDILDLSKLEAGKLSLAAEPFSLRDCVDSVISLLAPFALDKHLELVDIVADDVPDQLLGDATRISQILTNLLNNAIKFTAEGEVLVRVMLDRIDLRDGRVGLLLSVSDTGCGIPKEQQREIFSPFSQGAQRQAGGTGLGLSICQRLAEAMGGRIWVVSQPEQGSTFQVSLNLKLDQSQRNRAQSGPLGDLRCLLLEPHFPSRLALRQNLRALGCQVLEQESYDYRPPATGEPMDLLVVGLRGRDFEDSLVRNRMIECIRQWQLPSLVLVSHPDQGVQASLLAQGVDQCRTKPLRRGLLKDAVDETLRHSREQAPLEPPVYDPPPPRHCRLDGYHLLVADDNEINLSLLIHLLEPTGAHLLVARNGVEAVQLAQNHLPDLAILDIHMPELDGLGALRRIRELPGGSAMPALALTADAMRRSVKELQAVGFTEVLTKPVDDGLLYREILDALELVVAQPVAQAAVPTAQPESDRPAEPVDRDLEFAIRKAAGSAQLAEQLYNSFLGELPGHLSEMQQLLERGDPEALWQSGHRLQGSAALCGVPALHQSLVDFQGTLRSGGLDASRSHWQRVWAAAQRLLSDQQVV